MFIVFSEINTGRIEYIRCWFKYWMRLRSDDQAGFSLQLLSGNIYLSLEKAQIFLNVVLVEMFSFMTKIGMGWPNYWMVFRNFYCEML